MDVVENKELLDVKDNKELLWLGQNIEDGILRVKGCGLL